MYVQHSLKIVQLKNKQLIIDNGKIYNNILTITERILDTKILLIYIELLGMRWGREGKKGLLRIIQDKQVFPFLEDLPNTFPRIMCHYFHLKMSILGVILQKNIIINHDSKYNIKLFKH